MRRLPLLLLFTTVWSGCDAPTHVDEEPTMHEEPRAFENPVLETRVVRDPQTGIAKVEFVLKPEAREPRYWVAEQPLGEGVAAVIRRPPGQAPEVVFDPKHVEGGVWWRVYEALENSRAETLTLRNELLITVPVTPAVPDEEAWYRDHITSMDRRLRSAKIGDRSEQRAYVESRVRWLEVER